MQAGISIGSEPKWARCLAHPEPVLAVILTAAAVSLHVLVITHASPLWRDEVGTLGLATLPHFSETWRMLTHNADPILFPCLVRLWAALGLGNTDFGLRVLGSVIGFCLVAALWVAGRAMRLPWPVVSLALLATNLQVVRWGDSLRPYGFGSALLLLLVGSVWSFVSGPSRNRYWMACFVGVLCAQCLYQNSFFLLATCCSGAVVCLRRRQRREAMVTLCIGFPAALSVLPYVPLIVQAQSWLRPQRAGFDLLRVWITLSNALDSSVRGIHWAWVALFLLALGIGWRTLATGSGTAPSDPGDLRVFGGLNLILGIVGLLVFHWIAKLQFYPWHSLPAMAFAAVNIEAALAHWGRRVRTPWLILLGLVSLAPFSATFREAECAHTNLNVVAAQMSSSTEDGDLIVVYPWYFGLTFARYYTGSVEWVTLPSVNDLRFHRYDLLNRAMLADNPIKPVLDRVERALASGHRVWLVGGLPGWKPGNTRAPGLTPAPGTQKASLAADYSYLCGRQAAEFLSKHAQQSWPVKIPSDHCLIGFEVAPVYVVQGWNNAENAPGP